MSELPIFEHFLCFWNLKWFFKLKLKPNFCCWIGFLWSWKRERSVDWLKWRAPFAWNGRFRDIPIKAFFGLPNRSLHGRCRCSAVHLTTSDWTATLKVEEMIRWSCPISVAAEQVSTFKTSRTRKRQAHWFCTCDLSLIELFYGDPEGARHESLTWPLNANFLAKKEFGWIQPPGSLLTMDLFSRNL